MAIAIAWYSSYYLFIIEEITLTNSQWYTNIKLFTIIGILEMHGVGVYYILLSEPAEKLMKLIVRA